MRSKLSTTWVMLAFGVVFLASGVGAAYGLVVGPMLRARAAETWRETSCRVTSSEIVEGSTSKGKRQYRAAIAYTYAVEGRAYEGTRIAFTPPTSTSDRDDAAEIIARYPRGADVPCWYDPASPGSVTLSRTIPPSLWMVFPVPFLLVGLVTLRIGARSRRDALAGTPTDDGRVAYRRRGSGIPEIFAAAVIAALLGAVAYLASALGVGVVGWVAFWLAIVALGWLAHELRRARSVMTIVAPVAIERDADAQVTCTVTTPWCAPPVTANAIATERRRHGRKVVEHTVATVPIHAGELRVVGPPTREETDGFVEWHVEVRTHLPYGPDLRARAPIRVD